MQVVQTKQKEKWRFLQKYWHKGAFFQETADNPYAKDQTDNIYTRDFSAPTGEDKMDRTVLPKVMQVGAVDGRMAYGCMTLDALRQVYTLAGVLHSSTLYQPYCCITRDA